jgi:peptidoglycan hydrolase-like protein with peptidoglycan-binding domain
MSARRNLTAGGAAALLVAGVALAATGSFGGNGNAAGEGNTAATATATATVTRQTITAQTQASATLAFAGAATIVAPAGTASSQVLQARQAAATAEGALAAARTMLDADATALTAARAKLAADRQKRTVDCAGANAAQAAASGGADGAASGACAADQQTVVSDEQSSMAAAAKVASDRQSVTSGLQGLAGARAALATAESSAAAFGESAAYTRLPAAGDIVTRGQELYRVTDEPVVLLYGRVAAWRAFERGMSPGRDVAQLNANLRALGYGRALRGTTFSDATEAAVRAFQSARGLTATGRLLVGSVVFQPAAVRVTKVTPSVGAAIAPGPVLDVTSRVRQVVIQLDAGQQAGVAVGDAVTITLPDGRETPGVVSSVGAVATSADNSEGPPEAPTIEVDVRPSDPTATGNLDQAPVTVSITTSTAKNALVVPVAALLALAGGGYAVEQVTASGAHVLVPVSLGLFDDAHGLVQVTDTTIAAGRRVVVPSA